MSTTHLQPLFSGSGSPLTAEQLAEVREAEKRRRVLRRATGVAKFDAWV
jgi:hypothetical protein